MPWYLEKRRLSNCNRKRIGIFHLHENEESQTTSAPLNYERMRKKQKWWEQNEKNDGEQEVEEEQNDDGFHLLCVEIVPSNSSSSCLFYIPFSVHIHFILILIFSQHIQRVIHHNFLFFTFPSRDFCIYKYSHTNTPYHLNVHCNVDRHFKYSCSNKRFFFSVGSRTKKWRRKRISGREKNEEENNLSWIFS